MPRLDTHFASRYSFEVIVEPTTQRVRVGENGLVIEAAASATATPPSAFGPRARDLEVALERIESEEALDRLGPEWQRLAERAAGGFPFRTFEWHRAWWIHLRARSTCVRDTLALVAARSARGELVGVAPFMRTERPAWGPLRIRSLEFLGADRNVTELRGMICAPGWDGAVASALQDHLAARAGTWDVVCWRGLRVGSDAHAVISGAPRAWIRDANPNYLLPLPRTWEELRASRRRNLKESLRKCYNSLRRGGHTFTVAVAADEADVMAALERFFALHRARAALTGTVRHPDVFAAPRARAFLTDACGRLARRGIVRVFELRIGGAVVATRLGFVAGDTLHLYFSGYDPAWRRYSVMTTCVAEAVKWAIQQRLSYVNLSNSTDVAKLRWSPERVDLSDVVQLAPGLRARLAGLAYEAARLLRTTPGLQFLRR
jgi:CelD/BcsL family acetyltransferase involved in cellulose biosynthesis